MINNAVLRAVIDHTASPRHIYCRFCAYEDLDCCHVVPEWSVFASDTSQVDIEMLGRPVDVGGRCGGSNSEVEV